MATKKQKAKTAKVMSGFKGGAGKKPAAAKPAKGGYRKRMEKAEL